ELFQGRRQATLFVGHAVLEDLDRADRRRRHLGEGDLALVDGQADLLAGRQAGQGCLHGVSLMVGSAGATPSPAVSAGRGGRAAMEAARPFAWATPPGGKVGGGEAESGNQLPLSGAVAVVVPDGLISVWASIVLSVAT